MKTIVLTHAAAKDLDALPEEAREFVMSGLISYAMAGKGDVGFRAWTAFGSG